MSLIYDADIDGESSDGLTSLLWAHREEDPHEQVREPRKAWLG